jgi:sugar fermentation stimulation protein A
VRLTPPLAAGRLIRRYQRFLADIETSSGERITVHCPNTGAMTGCAQPGSEAWYSRSANRNRKYPHTLEVVVTEAGRVGVNTLTANKLVAEAIASKRVIELTGYATIRAEPAIPDERGRFDFVLGCSRDRPDCYVEVKNLTLGNGDGLGAFPDAVSERALKHVHALSRQVVVGYRAVLVFCVQHTGVRCTTTADDIHPQYGVALRQAMAVGVEVVAYGCSIERDEILLTSALPFNSPSAHGLPGR